MRDFREALFNSEIRENSHEARKWNAFLAARAAVVPDPKEDAIGEWFGNYNAMESALRLCLRSAPADSWAGRVVADTLRRARPMTSATVDAIMAKIRATPYTGITNEELMRARAAAVPKMKPRSLGTSTFIEQAALIAELVASLKEMREVSALCFRIIEDHSKLVDRFTAEATALGLVKGFDVRAEAALAKAEKARAS